MTKVLLKLFIKDYENVKDAHVRELYGKLAGVVGIISNIILCLMKVAVGIFTASIAIVADGINNLADASSSVITLIGFRLASMPEDKEHPYGHARIEYLTGLLVSMLIIVVGVQLFSSSVDKVIHPDEFVFSYVTIAVLAASIVIKIWQAMFNIGLGKRINSVALIATGTDSRNDVIATSAVLVSVIVTEISGFQLDGYMGCIVALFIIWSGISLVKETVSPLLGEAPDEELVRSISEMTSSFEGVLGIHDLMVHNYGPGKIFASIHIEVDADGDIMAAHDMIDNIEKVVSAELGIQLVAHMDPIKTNDPLLIHMKEIITETLAGVEGVANIHDFRMVPGPTHTNIIFDAVISHGCKYTQEEIKEIVEKRVKEENPAYFVVITFDKEYTGYGFGA